MEVVIDRAGDAVRGNDERSLSFGSELLTAEVALVLLLEVVPIPLALLLAPLLLLLLPDLDDFELLSRCEEEEEDAVEDDDGSLS